MDALRSMQSFVRIVETGSFTAVAKELNTTQATISKRLAALEKHLGVKLFVRGNRQHALTEAGKSYFQQVSRILDEIEQTEITTRSLTTTPRGHLRVSAPTMFGCMYLATPIARFLETYPDIKIDIKFDEKKIDLVKEGVDVAVRLGNLPDSSLVAKKLGRYQLIIVASPHYLNQHPCPSSLSELKDIIACDTVCYRKRAQTGY